MEYERYDTINNASDLSSFDFTSVGGKGSAHMRVIFTPTGLHNVFVLAFGCVTDNDDIDDRIVNNNGDRNKILATVADAVISYTDHYPNRLIYFISSSKERTRLYRMAVGLNLEELTEKFDIYAETEKESLTPFCKNMEIKSFLIKRKNQ